MRRRRTVPGGPLGPTNTRAPRCRRSDGEHPLPLVLEKLLLLQGIKLEQQTAPRKTASETKPRWTPN